MLDGKPFLFAGSNAYWLPFINVSNHLKPHRENGLQCETNMPQESCRCEKRSHKAKIAGLNVIRTWAFNEKNATFIPGGLPAYGGEGTGASPVYF